MWFLGWPFTAVVVGFGWLFLCFFILLLLWFYFCFSVIAQILNELCIALFRLKVVSSICNK